MKLTTKTARLAMCPLFLLTLAAGCQKRSFNKGEFKESMGRYNSPESLGLSANALDWESIRTEVRGAREQAWSDTWWPHYSKGIADRYVLRNSGQKSENLSGRGVTISDYVSEYLGAVRKADPKELALLSPAEKYDYLMSDKAIPESLLRELEAYSKKHKGTSHESTLLKLEDKLERLGKYDEMYTTLNQEYARESKAAAAGFTPLLTEGQQLAEKLKPYLPITSHDWNLWLTTFSWAHDEEWAWMGICNGWSPAALREKKPLRSVMAIRGGKRVLFTEGDIRGLLSWVWGWQFPNQTLGAGVRCDASESKAIVKNRRIIDGRICEGKGSRSGRCVGANTIFIGTDDPFAEIPGRFLRFGFDAQNRKTHEAHLMTSLGNAYYEADIKDLKTGQKRRRLLQITQACRDMNPGLYHAALVDLVGRRKLGFVVDADRYTQVWNQPVFAYELTYLPIAKRDGTVASPGEPVALEDVKNDIYAEFRAEKTNRIVQVRSRVVYAAENGPFASYSPTGEQEHRQEVVSDYTLEITSKGKIIGGEWGLLPGTPGVKPLRESNSSAPAAPDFIWNYPEGASPNSDLMNYGIVKKIHDCSTSPAAVTRFDWAPWQGTPLSYSECALD